MFSIAVYLIALSTRLDAQVATGNIRGVVADSTEAVIPNAKVILTNSGTGLQRTVITNESGDFNAPFMPLGDYQIAAEAPGFSRKVLTGINLQVDQTATLRIVLELGTATQSAARHRVRAEGTHRPGPSSNCTDPPRCLHRHR
jgi:hypothetical protein